MMQCCLCLPILYIRECTSVCRPECHCIYQSQFIICYYSESGDQKISSWKKQDEERKREMEQRLKEAEEK